MKREQEVLFRQTPLLMGFASEWAEPGAYRTEDFAGVPVLVVRGSDGRLRAFLNVCRHRGAKVADGCGTARLFSCPYHAWTYELSGNIRGIPDEAAFPACAPSGAAWYRCRCARSTGSCGSWQRLTASDAFRHRSLAGRARSRARQL